MSYSQRRLCAALLTVYIANLCFILPARGTADSGGPTGREGDALLLARLISAEAGSEPYEAQVAVGAVVVNRMAHPAFPGTLSGVIYQKGAFPALTDGRFDRPPADSALRAARDALNGCDPSGGALNYYGPDTAADAPIRKRPVLASIGKYRFCA